MCYRLFFYRRVRRVLPAGRRRVSRKEIKIVFVKFAEFACLRQVLDARSKTIYNSFDTVFHRYYIEIQQQSQFVVSHSKIG